MSDPQKPEAEPARAQPERRLAVRVPVEESVWIRAGWRLERARLLELSLTGARLVVPRPLAPGDALTLWLPSRFEGVAGRPLARACRVRVAWSEPVGADATGVRHLGVAVARFGVGAQRRMELALRRFQARFDRRGTSRLPFERRVIARGAGRPRVLVGRDLSAGGISVENAQGLAPGDALELAVHLGPGSTPLVVRARVVREIPRGGAALAFEAMTETQRRYLEKMIDALAVPDAVVLSEWREQVDATPTS